MAAVIASDNTSPEEKTQMLQISYALPPNNDVIDALRKGLVNTNESELRQRLQSEVLRLGDIEELPEVARLLLTSSVSPNQKTAFLYVLGNSIKDSAALPAVESLLTSGDRSIRAAAMEALWHIAEPKATKALVSGLEDPSRDVRYYSVRGLAEIAKQSQWAPSISEFQQHERRYLNHWREWGGLSPH